MNKFIITTDSTSDLPLEYLEKNNVGLLSIHVQIGDGEYLEDGSLNIKGFYDKMRQGIMLKTSQVNPEQAKIKFEEYLKEGYDILHISFSSALSGSYNSSRIAADQLQDEYKNNKIVVLDSLCASLGEGLLVYKALELKESGKSIDEISKWIEENKLNVCHYFTVDDLNHLYRGGRISKSTAILGTMIGVKPILNVDNEGCLKAVSKVRGRKKSLITLVDNMEKLIKNSKYKNDIIFIGHADASKDAEFVANKIKERLGIESFFIAPIGAAIGTHTGPGAVTLFFMAENR